MKLFSIFFLSIFVYSNSYKYWEDFSDNEKKQILQSESVIDNARKLYEDKFKISDNVKSLALLQELTSIQEDSNLKALYFYIFNKIVKSSDGSLLEILPIYVLNMILSDVSYVLDYLINNIELIRSYGEILGVEFFFKQGGSSDLPYTFNQFKSELEKGLECNKYEKVLSNLYKTIETQIESMD